MIIPELIRLSKQGNFSMPEITTTVIDFDLGAVGNTKAYKCIDEAEIPWENLYILTNLDPASYRKQSKDPQNPKQLSQKFFRGIPLMREQIAHTTSLLKLSWLVYTQPIYQNLIDSGKLDKTDARLRVAAAKRVSDPKKLISKSLNVASGCQLLVIGKTRKGLYVVLGLRKKSGLWSIDETLSIQISNDMYLDSTSIIHVELQVSEGRGRNLYGKAPSPNQLPGLLQNRPDEAMRTFGHDESIDVTCCRNLYFSLPQFPIFTPGQDQRFRLIFVPTLQTDFPRVADAVGDVKANNQLYYDQQKRKAKNTAETETNDTLQLKFLPVPRRSLRVKILLGNYTEGDKSYWVTDKIFVEVPVFYFQLLNKYLNPIRGQYVYFFKACWGSPDGKKIEECAYAPWIRLFAAALDRKPFDILEIWQNYPTYLHRHSAYALLEGEYDKAKTFIRLIPHLKRLQQLITLMKDPANLKLSTDEIESTLDGQEKVTTPTQNYLIPIWDSIPDWCKKKLEEIHLLVQGGMPDKDLSLFLKGALTGLYLNSIAYKLKERAGRNFTACGGQHPTWLRGQLLLDRFLDAKALILGLSKETARELGLSTDHQFLSTLMTLLGTEVSEQDAFNNGFCSYL